MARECIRRVLHGEPQAERIVGKNILRGAELFFTQNVITRAQVVMAWRDC